GFHVITRRRGCFRVVEKMFGQTSPFPRSWSAGFAGWLQGMLGGVCAHRHFREDGWRAAETLDGLRRFSAPLVAPEALVGFPIPFDGIGLALPLLVDFGQLEGHHGVARLQKELFEFGGGVRAGARFADARLNLFPVSHGWAF